MLRQVAGKGKGKAASPQGPGQQLLQEGGVIEVELRNPAP